MNDPTPSAQRSPSQNPWNDRISFPRLHSAHLTLSLLALAASTLGLSMLQVPAVSFLLLAVLFTYVVFTVRSPGGVSIILLLSALAAFMTGSLSAAVIVLSLIVGTSSLAFLFTTRRTPYAAPLVLLAGFGLAFWITKNVWQAFPILLMLPPAILLAYATTSGKGRTSAVCLGAAGYLISGIALLLGIVYQARGSVSMEMLQAVITDTKEYLVNAMIGVRDWWIETVRTSGVENAEEMIAYFYEIMTPDNLRAIFSSFFRLLPGASMMLASILSFATHLELGLHYRFVGWTQVLTREYSTFTMSVTASVLYYISFLCTLFFDTSSMFGAVMQNLCLVLLPGFGLLGAWSLFYRIKHAKGGAGLFLILMLAAFLCCAGVSSFLFLALWGANCAIGEAAQRKMMERLSSGNQNDQNDRS